MLVWRTLQGRYTTCLRGPSLRTRGRHCPDKAKRRGAWFQWGQSNGSLICITYIHPLLILLAIEACIRLRPLDVWLIRIISIEYQMHAVSQSLPIFVEATFESVDGRCFYSQITCSMCRQQVAMNKWNRQSQKCNSQWPKRAVGATWIALVCAVR